MSAQSRHQSRRSLSIFSFDHIRSLSRTGNRSVHVRSPDNSRECPSSDSCNPFCQVPAPSEPNSTTLGVASDDLTNSATKQRLKTTIVTRLRTRAGQSDRLTKARPHSWFSLSRTSSQKNGLGRSFSVHLPKDTSSSSVGRSVISAPVLTATTNVDIAQKEGLNCQDTFDVDLKPAMQSSEGQQNAYFIRDNFLEHLRLNSRRFFNVVPNKKVLPHGVRGLKANKMSAGEVAVANREEPWRFSIVERGVARRRAETINLCRDKITKLTGHGHIRRKSIGITTTNIENTMNPGSDDFIAWSAQSSGSADGARFLTLNASNPDLLSNSFTRSFTAAVDKLDFDSASSTGKMGFMKSRSSIFNLRKRNKPTEITRTEKHDAEQNEKLVTSSSNRILVNNKGHGKEGLTLTEALNQIQPAHQHRQTGLIGAPTEPLQFSAAANGYVAVEPTAGYPKGIKVLGMHSNTMEFATAPEWVTNLPKPPKHTPTVEEVTPVEDDDDEEQVIRDAPIYSPSLGNLSQYARPTPSPAKPMTKQVDRSAPETPTEALAEKKRLRRLGLRTSKSGIDLLSIFSKGSRENADNDEIKPLESQDKNQKLARFRQLRKSRSTNLPAMFRKEDTLSMKEPLLQKETNIPSRPVKPSPLRYEARSDSDVTKSIPGPFVAQKRTPPRGSVTPADRAKRMAIVGMPRESFDKHIEALSDVAE